MKEMKLIDLLNMFANDKDRLPIEIEFHEQIWVITSDQFCIDYYNKEAKKHLFSDDWALTTCLNDRVKIIKDYPKVMVEMTENEYWKYLDYKERRKNK